MKILLTGASGFLGRHVLKELENYPLRLLVLPDDHTLPEIQKYAETVTADITSPESLPPVLDGITHVVHLAGFVNGGSGPNEKFMAVNAQGTFNLAQASLEAGVTHFIYTSSITVYGHSQGADEESPPVSTPGYPASKIQAEKALNQLLPEKATILRLPLLLGAGDKGFMYPAIDAFRQSGRVVIIGSGNAPWSVLAASDAARAITLCITESDTHGCTYNVLGENITNAKLLRAIGKMANCSRETHLPYYVAWTAAALNELIGGDGLTRSQVRALSRPLSMKGDRFAKLGFHTKTSWQEALLQASN
ncbi:MAG: NAD-dependent epimerase/dehydratase family protein [Candidatus Brocadiales bacterium]|nr:NAD-dependent epimerase/dehydratase family protein [Candidatus Brocadiales bacterium]